MLVSMEHHIAPEITPAMLKLHDTIQYHAGNRARYASRARELAHRGAPQADIDSYITLAVRAERERQKARYELGQLLAGAELTRDDCHRCDGPLSDRGVCPGDPAHTPGAWAHVEAIRAGIFPGTPRRLAAGEREA